jgi:hypothetical protein
LGPRVHIIEVEQVTATKVFQVKGYPLLFFASTPLLFLLQLQVKAALAGHLESRLSIFTSSSSSVGVPVFLVQLLLESFLSKGQVVG